MTNNDFERLNALADKALNEVVTDNELIEFSKLLSVWNESTELNLYSHRNTFG